MARCTVLIRPVSIGLAAALLLTSPRLANAAEPSDTTLRAAIAAKEAALESNDAALWQQTLTLFLKLDAQAPSKEAKYEVGSAAAELGAVGFAYDYFDQALALGLSGPARDKALAYNARQRPTLGFLTLEGSPGTLITIDGQQRGSLPLTRPLAVSPGPLQLRATLPDGKPLQREVRITAGQTLALTLAAEPTPKTPTPPTEPTGKAPPAGPTSTSAAPTLLLGAAPGGGLVRLQEGAAPPHDDPSNKVGVSLLIVGGVIFASSAVLLPMSFGELSARREALKNVCHTQSSPDQCERPNAGQRATAQDHVDAIATWSAVRGGAFGGLVVGAALGTWGLLSLSSHETNSTELHLTVLPSGGVLTQAKLQF